MVIVSAFIVGLVVGLISHRAWSRRAVVGSIRSAPVNPTPALPDSVYAETRSTYIQAYQKSIAEFDRLVIWGAGGRSR